MQPRLLSADELAAPVASLARLQAELDRLLLGRPAFHHQVLVGVLARGHLLIEGVPGVGKTALVKALGPLLGLDFRRVQFTPDLMPGDVLGAHILEETASGRRELAFHPGPVFTNILLADEINRASPKTQSALLEAMQERAVTAARHDPRPAVTVLRPRLAEPDRARGHLSAARGAARSLPLQAARRCSLSRGPRRDRRHTPAWRATGARVAVTE